MTLLKSDQFAEFFQAVHGHAPFKWQERFAREVFVEGFHDVVRVPTACGKTSVMDVAVFYLALQAHRKSEQRTAPRRLCFVVDRRLVVDEVTEHAMKIRNAVQAAARGDRNERVLRVVAERLADLAVDSDDPLRVVRLRGSVYRDDGWAADPLTPTIIVSTVDQIGSRLLFRGYGVSRRSRPLQAGLLAFDTRIILDEAHLSNVFAETLDTVRRFQGWAEDSPLPLCRFVGITRMSATTSDSGRSFELTKAERRDERLKPRLEATKCGELIPVPVDGITNQMRKEQPRKAREQEQKNREALIQKIVSQAKALAGLEETNQDPNRPRVIGVVVNRVATARAVFEKLRKCRDGDQELDAILLTGRIRPFDRDRLLEEWLPKIKAGRAQRPELPLFVVATQTVEVGANLDFDALVTEAASLDALRQRFGRLDRLGRRHERKVLSPACILIRSDQVKKSDDDPVYGSALAATWKGLTNKKVAMATGKGKARSITVDFGVNALDAKLPLKTEDIRPMLAPLRETPLLFPAHLDVWVQTDPVPEPDPDVAPFLHGRADTPADVQVIWRADLTEGNRKHWADIVALMPPRTREALSVPIYEARAWLQGMPRSDSADVEGVCEDISGRENGRSRRVLRWRGAGKMKSRPVTPDDIRPGDTIVVPAAYGGADAFGWNPQSKDQVKDVAESCLAEVIASYPKNAFRRPKLRLRLHPTLLPDTDDLRREKLKTLLDTAVAAVRSEAENTWAVIQKLLSEMQDILSPPHRAAVVAFLRGTSTPDIKLYAKESALVLSGTFTVSLSNAGDLTEAETEYDEPEDDEASFSPDGRAVLLSEHGPSVGKMAGRFGVQCGLRKELTEVLSCAGRWHDEGKRDVRFQAWLHGSELKALAALAKGEVLAKSGRDPTQWQRGLAFGYPRGSRHEFVSVRLFEEAGMNAGETGDLARFLIGTHHGLGRPFPPVLDDREPVQVMKNHNGKRVTVSSEHGLYRLNSGWVELFWKMVRRYGWWGITYLEALLISADRTVSAREQAQTSEVDRSEMEPTEAKA